MSEGKIVRFLDGRIMIRVLENKAACIDSKLERMDEAECLNLDEHFSCD
jgi:hypothetical protein